MDRWKASCIGKQWRLFDIDQDIGEQNDLSKQHPEQIQSMISATKSWSQNHTQPLWFDTEKAGKQWADYDMPNHQAIFPAE